MVIVPKTLFPDVPNQIELHSKHPLLRVLIGASVHGLINDSTVTSYTELHQRKSQGLYVAELAYRTPFVVSEGVAVTLNITYDYCLEAIDTFEIGTPLINCRYEKSKSVLCYAYMIRHFSILMGETDKTLYRPGETVRFRFLAFNPRTSQPDNTKPAWPLYRVDRTDFAYPKLVKIPDEEVKRREGPPYFDVIYVEDPQRNRLKEWTSVLQPTALSLSFQIPSDASEGRWRIVARMFAEVKEIEIDVRQYVMPRFLVSVTGPAEVSLTEEFLQLRVCAAYTNSTSFFRGHYDIQVCLCSRSVWEHQQELGIQFQDGTCLSVSPNSQSVISRCVQSSGLLETNPENGGCVHVKPSLRTLMQETRARTDWDQQLGAIVKVTEAIAVETASVVTKFTQIGIRVYRTPKLELKVDPTYRTGLPIFGSVRLSGLDDLPPLNATASISVMVFEISSFGYWGPSLEPGEGETGANIFKIILTPDEQGFASFVIPPLSSGNDLRVKARVDPGRADFPPTRTTSSSTLRDRLCPGCSAWVIDNEISTSEHVRHWQSRSPLALTVEKTAYDTTEPCPGTLRVSLLANSPLAEEDIFMVYLSQGTPKRISALLRSSSSNGQACRDQDGPLGHYTCNAAFKPGEIGEITCLSGWRGDNCMTPDCPDEDCGLGGLCVAPGVCSCRDGWRGERCEICEPRKGCLHGDCRHGNDCVCRDGFTGRLCDRPQVLYDIMGEIMPLSAFNSTFVNGNLPPAASSAPLPEAGTGVRRTVFKYEAVFKMDVSFVSTLRAVVCVYHQGNEDKVPGVYEIISDFIKIEGFKSCSTQTLVKGSRDSVSTGLLNQHTVLPGDVLQLTLRVPTTGHNTDSQTPGPDHVCILRMLSVPFKHLDRPPLGSFINPHTYVGQLEDFFYQGDFPVFSTKTAFEAAGIDFIRVGPFRSPAPRAVMWPVFTPLQDSEQFASAFQDSELLSSPTRTLSSDSFAFSSSWFFDYVKLQPDSVSSQIFSVNLTAPNVISSWELSTTCFAPDLGLWMPQSLDRESIHVTLPFHFEFAPVARMRLSEVLHPSLTISLLPSGRRACYEISVSLVANDADWQVLGSRRLLRCLCTGDPRATLAPIALTPRRLGHLTVTVRVVALTGSSMCSEEAETGSERVISATDTIRRRILVVPGGQEVTSTVGGLLCLPTSVRLKQTLQPFGPVGSLRSYLSVCGNILGRMPDNVNKLIPLPEGSAEQSLVTVSAGVRALEYLASTANLAKKEVKGLLKSIIQHVNIGYASLLTFKHKDGSFSTLGQQSTHQGSTWLTALASGVLSETERTMKDLKLRGLNVVSLDPLPGLSTAFDFLLTVQRPDGCFIERDVASRNRLRVNSAPDEQERTVDLALTSHVLSALSDIANIQRIANSSVYDNSVRSAVTCLLSTVDSLGVSRLPTSVLAPLSFALSRSPTGVTLARQDRVQGLLAELRRRAYEQNSDGGHLRWWADDASADFRDPAPAIETTAFALLALSGNQTAAENLAVIRWLLQQQDERGGFYTTQATIVTLKALVQALGLSRSEESPVETLVSVTLCPLDSSHACTSRVVTQVNNLNEHCTGEYLNDRPSVNGLAQSVIWEASSSQPDRDYCVSVGLTTSYLTLEPMNESPFSLEVMLNQGEDTKPECTRARLSACVRLSERAVKHSSPLTTGIILLSVQLPTGWAINSTESTSLRFLQQQQQPSAPLRVDMDAENQTVLVYFQAFTETESAELGGHARLLRCFTLDLQQTVLVESPVPSTISVQDYFAPHRRTSRTFTPNTCREYWGWSDLWRVVKNETAVAAAAAGPVCPRCSGISRKELIQTIEDSLCLHRGSLLLISPGRQKLESIEATAYEIAFGENIAVWNTTLKLADHCPCETVRPNPTSAFVMFSTSHPPVVGATEMLLTDFTIVSLNEVQEALVDKTSHFLPKTVPDKCERLRGLRRLLRRQFVYS
ncbi:hypothetical protein AAHC03_017084 [Spirometra sp. Aus1]